MVGSDPAKVRALPPDITQWKGDFDGMLKNRHIRVLVPYSRTLYFNGKGRERGVTADNVRDFETYLNTKYRKQLGNRPITIYLIPTTRDQIVRKAADGFGDIAAANLTVTDERKTLVDFIAALRKEATRRGLDPDKWFNNVEIIAAEKVGIETTTYVRNIFKYYTAYKLMLDREEAQKKARETVKPHR